MIELQHTTLQKSECPAATGQNAKQGTNKRILSEPTHDDKRFRNLQARSALLGKELQRTQVEGQYGYHYWLSRWGKAIKLRNLDQVDKYLSLAGGAV